MNTFPLDGKVCLIMGGLGRFPKAITTLMLKRGAKVYLCDTLTDDEGKVKLEAEYEVTGASGEPRVAYCKCDITLDEDVESAFASCAETFGQRPDVLINCAGVLAAETSWDRVYETNIKGVHRCIEAAFKHMGKVSGDPGPGGVVVNVASTAGLTCKIEASHFMPSFHASQHAIVTLTRCFGHQFWYEKTGVKVVCITPCNIEASLMFVDGSNSMEPSHTFPEGTEAVKKVIHQGPLFRPEDDALKLINVLNSNNGSIWLLKKDQLQPFNVPDYVLPKTK